MHIQHVRRLSFMINSIKEGQIEKEENIMKNVSEYFGSLVFDDRVMKATLSAEVYQSLKKTIDGGERDREDRLGPERACAQGWITLNAMRKGIALTTATAMQTTSSFVRHHLLNRNRKQTRHCLFS